MSLPQPAAGEATEPPLGEGSGPMKRLTEDQTLPRDGSERSSSPVPSVQSMKSDMSNLSPINFTEQERATEVSDEWELCDVCSSPAVKRCLTCTDSYCMTHVMDHYTSPDLERHQLQDLQHRSRCEQHNRELEFYCRTDQLRICSIYELVNHRGHDVIQQDKTDTDQNMKEHCKVTKKRGVPSPGPIQFHSVQPNSVTVCWSPPEGATGSYKYRVTWRGGQKTHRMVLAGCEMEVTGLLPAEKYHFTVSSLSEDDCESTCVERSVYTEVPVPENLTVDSSCGSLKWTRPEGVDEVCYLLELFSIGSEKKLKSIHTAAENYSISELAKYGNELTVHVSTVTNERQSKATTKSITTGDLRIVLLGKTGSGKSASGNTILGDYLFKEDISTTSVTNKCQKESAVINGRQITVVDTPGLFDTACSKESKEEIIRCMDLAAPGPHVFLLVTAFGPFTEEERNTIKRIKEMFGEEFLRYTIVLFTREDALQSKPLEKYLERANTDLRNLLKECENRYHSFNNRGRRGNGQVTKLLDKINDMLVTNQGTYYPTDMFQKFRQGPKTRGKN